MFIDRLLSTSTKYVLALSTGINAYRVTTWVDKSSPGDRLFYEYQYKDETKTVDMLVRKADPSYVDYRINEYPPIGDQLDALWKFIKANADKIDLAEAAPLLEAVQAVKDKHPKPPTNDIN